MSATDPMEARLAFRGPRCWVVSIVLGLVLGVAWSMLMPPLSAAHGAADADAPRVREIRPDGTQLERFADGRVVPWSDTPDHHTAETAPVTDHPPDAAADDHHHPPRIPLALCAPFVLLLASIAVMPFVNARFWQQHYPDFAFFLGGLVAGYYLGAFGPFGRHALLHTLIEYYSFMALVGGLFVVSGGILIRVNTRATPLANTMLLLFGSLLANVVGTTGASMLLIRPFMRMNQGRLRPLHVVLFIFIISNCAGCLTPIGDPPLYLGFLKGVPFEWTILHLWPMWATCVGLLLVIFFAIDSRFAALDRRRPASSELPAPSDGSRPRRVSITGAPAIICLMLMVAGVFIDPLLSKFAGISGFPFGATFQIIIAAVAYRMTSESIHEHNTFTFHPVQEVGMLFVGIFLTMIPALGYLSASAGSLGLETPTQFYFLTGSLSSVLDNAPTYLNFGQAALGLLHLPLTPEGIHRFITGTFELVHAGGEVIHLSGAQLLQAISLGAVFFGAMTYIGNGPNFMVKSISESAGVRMPSFFAYLGLAVLILLPVLVVVWAIFVR